MSLAIDRKTDHSVPGARPQTAAPGTPYTVEPWPDSGFPHEVIDRHPGDRTAIIHGDDVWSFACLKAASDRMGAALSALVSEPGQPIVVALPKSPMAIAAILGVWKAGGAFVPLDPAHANLRNDHVLADCGSVLAVTDREGARLFEGRGIRLVIAEELADPSQDWRAARPTPDQRAYTIYTSGSTGRPKGVEVAHGPLLAHLNATGPVYEMDESSRELPFLPFSSDGGHERWIVPLMGGGSIVLPEELLWTPADIVAAVRARGITHLSMPTSYVHEVATHLRDTNDRIALTVCSFGGEAMPKETFARIARTIQARHLINGYGPTETIMTPMLWRVGAGAPCPEPTAPIGRPVGPRSVVILDGAGAPVAAGDVGEIHLGGYCLAQGYRNLSDRTALSFVPDAFARAKDAGPPPRLYRTGDLGRFLADGSILFCGRVDDQIQIRGTRVEPAEIETVLRGFPDISNCAVVAVERSGAVQLAAYVVPLPGAALDTRSVRQRLAAALPPAMVPSFVIEIRALPLNANSKVDKAQLPPPRRSGAAEPARGPQEAEVLRIWREALGLDDIGVTDDLFEIGGNSITALRILPALKKALPAARPQISDLFNFPTVRGLVEGLKGAAGRPARDVVHLRRDGGRGTLYCFPGLLVSTRDYVKLVAALGDDQPATGFICNSLSKEGELSTAVPEISARYAEIIRRGSGGRPCAFLGWSWGGLLAYEAARLLGSDIDLRDVAMIDVCAMDSDFALDAVPRFAPGERERIEARLHRWLERSRMGHDWRRLIGLMDAHAYDQFLRFVEDSPQGLPEDGPGIGTREHTFFVLIDNALVFRRHELLPHDCPITPYAASDTLRRRLQLIDWHPLSPRAGAVVTVPGTDHLTIIGDPAFHGQYARRLSAAFA